MNKSTYLFVNLIILLIKLHHVHSTSTLIIGGSQVTNATKFPFIVRVVNKYSARVCGGSIIAENSIVTASHCLYESYTLQNATDFVVVAGCITPITFHEGEVSVGINCQKVDVEKIRVHSNFDHFSETKENDISILIVSDRLFLDRPTINYIDVANPRFVAKENSTCTLLGWKNNDCSGNTCQVDGLFEVSVTIREKSACSSLTQGQPLSTSQLCAGGQGKGGCGGDHGGPLFCEHDFNPGSVTLIGILSFGNIRCEAIEPNVYTSVAYFSNWIHNKKEGGFTWGEIVGIVFACIGVFVVIVVIIALAIYCKFIKPKKDTEHHERNNGPAIINAANHRVAPTGMHV